MEMEMGWCGGGDVTGDDLMLMNSNAMIYRYPQRLYVYTTACNRANTISLILVWKY